MSVASGLRSPAASAAPAGSAARDVVLDLVRVGALGVVLALPLVGDLRLPLLFLAAGLTAGVSGSLVADRLLAEGPAYRGVIGRRLLRVLGPFWLFAGIVVPPLVWRAYQNDGFAYLTIGDLWLWILPVSTPPTLGTWLPWMPPLGMLAAHVVLMLGAAGIFWLFRRWPRALVVLLATFLVVQALEVVQVDGDLGDFLMTLTGLTPCFLVGFAHRLGWLNKIPVGLAVALAVGVGIAAWWGLRAWPGGTRPGVLAVVGLVAGTALAAVVLLRASRGPTTGVPRWIRVPLTVLTRRFLTLLLWSAAAIQLGRWVQGFVPESWGLSPTLASVLVPAGVLLLIAVILGPVEDLAAGRRLCSGRGSRHPVRPRNRGRGYAIAAVALLLTGAVGVAGRSWAVNPIVHSEGTAACIPVDRPTDLNDPSARTIARMLISTAENSSLDWEAQYSYIEYNVEHNDDENRGYTAGIVGFTTRTGDLLRLVQDYDRIVPQNPLAEFLPALTEVNGTSSRAGLGRDFVAAWKQVAEDERFQKAQRDLADELYFLPAIAIAKEDGLGNLGQFIYVDAAVMHGFGVADNSFDHIHAAALSSATRPVDGGDERAWLAAFLDERELAMKAEVGHSDTTRVSHMQRVFLAEGNLDLLPPLRWSVYGDRFEITRLAPGGCR